MNQRLKKSGRDLVILAVGALFGSGAVWQWLHLRIERLEATAHVSGQAAEIHERLNGTLLRIIELSRRANTLCCSGTATDSTDKVESGAQLELATSEFTLLEKTLSVMEGREPRKINLDFVKPMGVREIVMLSCPEEDNEPVFISPGDNAYHCGGCLRLVGQFRQMTLGEAKLTHEPCPKCVQVMARYMERRANSRSKVDGSGRVPSRSDR